MIHLSNFIFFKLLSNKARFICIATGIIGTPIHETGHALMCILFGHKITKIRFFQINENEGSMGFVEHSYNPKNIYHKIGNFFISIGPILLGTLFLFLALFILMPNAANKIYQVFSTTAKLNTLNTFVNIVENNFNCITNIFTILTGEIHNFFFWLYMLLACSISLHMNLSSSDIKQGFSGLVPTLVTVIIISALIALISDTAITTIAIYINIAVNFFSCIMLLSMFISLFQVFLACVIALFYRIIKR